MMFIGIIALLFMLPIVGFVLLYIQLNRSDKSSDGLFAAVKQLMGEVSHLHEAVDDGEKALKSVKAEVALLQGDIFELNRLVDALYAREKLMLEKVEGTEKAIKQPIKLAAEAKKSIKKNILHPIAKRPLKTSRRK